MQSSREMAIEIWNSAVAAVRPQPLIQNAVTVDQNELRIGSSVWSLTDIQRIVVVGAGKAAVGMAVGLDSAIGYQVDLDGWVNAPNDTVPSAPDCRIHLCPARPASVNEPTEEAVAGTKQILRLAAECGSKDLCVALISGGGSALMPAPIEGVSLQDKIAVTRFLSAAGASINQLNTVRKHLSIIKGGGLLRHCNAGNLITLVLSDVLGDPLDVIASGPTVPDSSSRKDAREVLRQFDKQQQLPPSIYHSIENDAPPLSNNQVQSTIVVLGNNQLAVDSAKRHATDMNFTTTASSALCSEGAAEAIGFSLAEEIVASIRQGKQNTCIISGGEPTVRLQPADKRGKGGRNQQLALAAYVRLLQLNLSDSEWEKIAVLSGGTDGEDGPTDAAGAIVDKKNHLSSIEQRLSPAAYLKHNDAYHFFEKTGSLLKTGPTGTNVCDIRVALNL